MIPANELRIGNWVKIDPPEEGYPGICMVESISRIKVFLHCEEADYFIEKYIANIEPIPLTPEILEKAGFEERDNWLKLRIHSFHNFFIGYNNGVDFYLLQFGQAGIKPNIKHLHQLQNLYFALTGTELKINL